MSDPAKEKSSLDKEILRHSPIAYAKAFYLFILFIMENKKQEQEILEISKEEATEEAVVNFVEDSSILDFYNNYAESFIYSIC